MPQISAKIKKTNIKKKVKDSSKFKTNEKQLKLFAKKLDKNSDVLLLTKESINEVVIFERIKFKLNGSKSEKKGLDILQKIFNKIRIYSTKERFEFTKRIGLEIHKKEKNEVIGVLENISKELNL